MSPQRIQRRRTRGWRMPEGAVYVGRPTKWGNPWRVDPTMQTWWSVRDRTLAVTLFRDALDGNRGDRYGYPSDVEIRAELAGRALACWCPLDQPCHADVLLEIANGGDSA
jgi:hypothetical protein